MYGIIGFANTRGNVRFGYWGLAIYLFYPLACAGFPALQINRSWFGQPIPQVDSVATFHYNTGSTSLNQKVMSTK